MCGSYMYHMVTLIIMMIIISRYEALILGRDSNALHIPACVILI